MIGERDGCMMCLRVFVFFFFSSRRRHTRLQGDWSSDVCSSDLLELHPRGQAPDIVVALYESGRIVVDRDAFDDIGIERTLGEKVGVSDLLERLLKHLDERLAYDLALLLGLPDALEAPQEDGRRVDDPEVD